MKHLRNDWNSFWFKPTSPVTLGLFRLVFGVWTLLYGALLFPEAGHLVLKPGRAAGLGSGVSITAGSAPMSTRTTC